MEPVPECTHCWHGTGIFYATLPPIYPERCCHCGEKRERTAVMPTTEGHGPYHPKPWIHPLYGQGKVGKGGD